MKVILWATLSANGNYAMSDAAHPPKPETLQDFAEQVKKVGNFIVGRKTFENFRAGGGPNPAFQGVDIVVVSATREIMEGAVCVTSPEAAIKHLEDAGHHQALLAGGEYLHNSFLEKGLVNEVVFNIAPVFEGAGMSIHLPSSHYRELELQACKELGEGVIQLKYALKK